MAVQCIKCREEIPAGRLKALPGATTCVNCSSSKMKRSITVTKGEGEDTYNDLIIVDHETYVNFFGKDTKTSSGFQNDEVVNNDQD
jgi:hypothetical protein